MSGQRTLRRSLDSLPLLSWPHGRDGEAALLTMRAETSSRMSASALTREEHRPTASRECAPHDRLREASRRMRH